MLLLQPRRYLRKIYPRAIWHGDRDKPYIYLTFDDGPIPNLTEWALDELKKYGIKATFFCVGENILKHPELFKKIVSEGHGVGNHSMSHLKGFSARVETYLHEVDQCRELTRNKLFRPPYGQMRRGQYRALLKKGYKIVMWDVISYDYEKIHPERCLNTVITKSRNGSIIVFHDNLKAETNLKFCLPRCVEFFLEQGFEFKTLEGSLPI